MLGQPRCADATAVARQSGINHADGRSGDSTPLLLLLLLLAAALSSQLRRRIDAALLKLVSNTA